MKYMHHAAAPAMRDFALPHSVRARTPGRSPPRRRRLLRNIAGEVTTEPDVDVRDLSVEEGRQLLDEQARRYLHMSGAEFARRWVAGELDPDARPDVMRVAMLLPLAGQ